MCAIRESNRRGMWEERKIGRNSKIEERKGESNIFCEETIKKRRGEAVLLQRGFC